MGVILVKYHYLDSGVQGTNITVWNNEIYQRGYKLGILGSRYSTTVRITNDSIDTVRNLVFWSRLAKKLEPRHTFNIIQQKQNAKP